MVQDFVVSAWKARHAHEMKTLFFLPLFAITLLLTGCMSTNKINPDAPFPTLQRNSQNIHQDFAVQQPKLHGCWLAQRKVLRDKPVKMEVKIEIFGEGKVKAVTIAKSSVRNAALEQCVRAKVKMFAFKDVYIPPDVETGETLPVKLGSSITQ